MKIRFDDGMEIDVSGPLRPVRKADGWYVVGEGMFQPCYDLNEAREIIKEMKAEGNSKQKG